MIRLRIFNYDYYNIFDNEYDRDLECPVLIICGRDSDGKFHTLKVPGNKGIYRPHMYVEDTLDNRRRLSELMFEEKILEWGEWPYPSVYNKDEKVLILYCQYPFEVKGIRRLFEHSYEADVKYEYMYMMKLKLEGGYVEAPNDGWVNPEDLIPVPEEEQFIVKPRVFYFDIESDLINKDEKFSHANANVISLVVYDNYTNDYNIYEWSDKNHKYWTEERRTKKEFKHPDMPEYSKEIIHHCRNERELLANFFELFRRHPDGLFGFNSHGGYKLVSVKSKSMRLWRNGFDEPVIYLRAKSLGLDKELQLMSPLPRFKNKYGHYYGVYHRGREEKFEVVIRGVTPLDFYISAGAMQYTEKYRNFFGESLDNYLKFFGKKGKLTHEGLTVAELKEVDLDKELRYNKRDVEGTLFLDKFFGFSNDIFDTVTLSLVNGIDILSATKIHKFLTLCESQDSVVYDTQYQGWDRNVWRGWIKERVGGYVADITRGVGGMTVIIDFSQLYPNIGRAANAGIDTLIQVRMETADSYIDKKGVRWFKKDCIITPSAPFRTDIESIEKKIWDKLIRQRNKYKKKLAEVFREVNGDTSDPMYKLYWSKQYNLKQRLVNNKFGANGNPGFVNYCLPVYNQMPATAQKIVKAIEKVFLPSIGYKIRGGDTDSLFLAIKSKTIEEAVIESDEIVEKCNEFIDKFVEEQFNIKDHHIVIGWEKIGPKFYGHAKKNYAMPIWADSDYPDKILPVEKRYVMYKGFELKKGNRADITEIVQKGYLTLAFNSENDAEFLSKITGFIKRADVIFEYLPWHKVCPRANLRKKLENYAANYFLRRAAETASSLIGSEYTLGSNGFLAWLENGNDNNLKTIMMFKREDEPKIQEAGLILSYKDHKKKYMVDKLDLLLSDYNTGYHQLLRAERIKSPMVL